MVADSRYDKHRWSVGTVLSGVLEQRRLIKTERSFQIGKVYMTLIAQEWPFY